MLPDNDLYVFISYARPDQTAAEQVEAHLKAAGFRVFRDTSEIQFGDNWAMTIDHALRETNRMVLLLSPASMPYRKEVFNEWFFYDQKGKPLYPLLVETCELNNRLFAHNYLDARADLPGALAKLEAALRAPYSPPQNPTDQQAQTLREYRQNLIAELSQPRYQLDSRFVQLTLLLDQGKEAQGPRYIQPPDARRYNNLGELLAETPEAAFVLLGDPGSGKSTLLRRLQLEDARDRLADDGLRVTFFIALNSYRAEKPGDPLPTPHEWLAARWRALYPKLPPLDDLLGSGRVLLLLDALNEMPHGDKDDYRARIELWQDFLRGYLTGGNRAVFTCRTLDYSAPLNSDQLPVRQATVNPMSPDQIQTFLGVYLPEKAEAVWQGLKNTPQMDLFRAPFFLKLLCEQVEARGAIPQGRAELFTGFVRRALHREIQNRNRLFAPDGLLDGDDHQQIIRQVWATAYQLPEGGCLMTKLAELAFKMQQNGLKNESVQIRVLEKQARALLSHPQDQDILQAAIELSVLDKDVARREILFFHQLLQEFFAARQLAANPDPTLAGSLTRVEWRAAQVKPTLAETLAALADNDPLPPLPATGWEETTVLAAAMSAPHPTALPLSPQWERGSGGEGVSDDFVRPLIEGNLPLAARCAAAPEVSLSPALKSQIQAALIARTEDPQADVRARIAAGLALGSLGDPRFERKTGPHGDYLLPPLVPIPAGTYPIGDDESDYDDEKPAHTVPLAAFEIGQFPVTNAEYALFIESGGYDDERWWETGSAKAWRRGEGTAEGPKQQWRDDRQTLQRMEKTGQIRELVKQQRITSKQADDWEQIARMDDDEFENLLDGWYPSGRQTQPAYWDDSAYNNPAQPVVGVCWHEARAYCAWLSAQVTAGVGAVREPPLPTFRLLTEAEREAAARGLKGRKFPYGETFDSAACNTFESHIRRTTPIGIFAAGRTPEGVFDLSGNVYDWTSSIYDQEKFPYPYKSEDGREDVNRTDARRVLRGGSWLDGLIDARAVSRDYYHAALRYNSIGFRLAALSPISQNH